MIRATANGDGAAMTLNASVSGPVVYLDNWAIYDLAEGDPHRRRRFIDAMHCGMDLLFSVTNAAELSGPQGRSAEAVRAFLDEIGPRWFPAKLDPTEVIKREMEGESLGSICIHEMFFKSYVAGLMRDYTPGCGKVIGVSDDFFRLGPIMDRVGPQRESIGKTSMQFDELLRNKLTVAFEMSKRDALWLDEKFPWLPFHASRPACFVYMNLLRVMVIEASSLKKNDGSDFCHAVMACAFASFATLDTRWKRRVDSLPKPNQLARIYRPSQLDQMVADMELCLRNRAA